jgi:hypothetical protein
LFSDFLVGGRGAEVTLGSVTGLSHRCGSCFSWCVLRLVLKVLNCGWHVCLELGLIACRFVFCPAVVCCDVPLKGNPIFVVVCCAASDDGRDLTVVNLRNPGAV